MKLKNKVLPLLLLATIQLFAQAADPVIITINNKDIKKSEFEYLYKKNNAYKQNVESIDDYKELFINLKLKVAEAEAYGLDTTLEFQKEFQKSLPAL